MSLRSLRRQLDKLRATLPPPPFPYEELPIEEWVDEEMQDVFSETTLKNTADEERFYQFLEELPRRLLPDIFFGPHRERVRNFSDIAAVETRVVDALPPHIERLRVLWADNFPARESRRQWAAQMESRYPRVRTRENGYGWWFNAQAKYARLRDKYADFEEEWAAFFRDWEEKCEGTERNAPMAGEMREDFIRICFAREAHREAHDTGTGFTLLAFPELFEEEE